MCLHAFLLLLYYLCFWSPRARFVCFYYLFLFQGVRFCWRLFSRSHSQSWPLHKVCCIVFNITIYLMHYFNQSIPAVSFALFLGLMSFCCGCVRMCARLAHVSCLFVVFVCVCVCTCVPMCIIYYTMYYKCGVYSVSASPISPFNFREWGFAGGYIYSSCPHKVIHFLEISFF